MLTEDTNINDSGATKAASSEVSQLTDLSGVTGPQRKYVSIDPVGYALQTLESSLNSRGIQTKTLFSSAAFALPGLAILELDIKLAELSKQRDRITVVRELLEHVDTNDAYRNYICTKLPFLLRHLPTRDHQEILKFCLSFGDRRVKAALSFAVLTSALFKGDAEFVALVSERRARELIALKHYELRELVAKALYMRAFRKLSFPKGLDRGFLKRSVDDPKAARIKVRERLYVMHGAIKEHLDVLERYPALATCRTTREFRRQLREALSITSQYIASPGKLPRKRLTRERLGKLVNFLAVKVPTELKYQVHFCRTTGLNRSASRDWTTNDIRNAREALSKMPRGHILAAPKLHRLVTYKGKDHYGWRSDDGTIRISDQYRRDHEFSREFNGANGAQVTIIHECGHGIQLGKAERDIKIDRRSGEILGPTSPLYDFSSFVNLSGWVAVLQRPVRWLYRDTVVALGEKLYLLNYPVDYNGQKLIFRLYEDQVTAHPGYGFGAVKKAKSIRILLAHSADARLSVRGNHYPDPFEQWAENFTEYMHELKRFRMLCPEQCLLFHLMFRKYPESSEEIQQLYRDVEKRIGERAADGYARQLERVGKRDPEFAGILPTLLQLEPEDLAKVTTLVKDLGTRGDSLRKVVRAESEDTLQPAVVEDECSSGSSEKAGEEPLSKFT